MGVAKLTHLPFFLKAASLALAKYPVLNSTIDVERMELTYHGHHNIGVDVDTERGLAVPVVKGCEGRSVLEIAEELNRLYALVSSSVWKFFVSGVYRQDVYGHMYLHKSFSLTSFVAILSSIFYV